jgi:hypothetical protein
MSISFGDAVELVFERAQRRFASLGALHHSVLEVA